MRSPLLRRGQWLRLLRLSLFVGALYDIALAAQLLFAPEVAEKLLRVPRPGEDFYLWLLAVLLGMLAAFYLLAAFDPISYRGNVVVAIAGRAVAGLVLVQAARKTGFAGLYVLAAGDLLFAAAHGLFWMPIRR